MYPNNYNNPYPDQPQGIDYLNQISTPPPKQGFEKKTKIIVAALLAFGIVSIAVISLFAQNNSPKTTPSQVAARIQKLLTVSQKYDKQIQSSKLQVASSSLVSILTTADAKISDPLQTVGIDYKKQKKDIGKLESSDELNQKLEDAFLNSQLDLTYAHEMNVQITDTIAMMQRLYKSTQSKSMKEYLNKTAGDLDNIQKQLQSFINEH